MKIWWFVLRLKVSSTIAGSEKGGFEDGQNAKFYHPGGVCVDLQGNIIVADYHNDKIRKITNGIVSTIAGSVEGFEDGQNAMFNGLKEFVLIIRYQCGRFLEPENSKNNLTYSNDKMKKMQNFNI